MAKIILGNRPKSFARTVNFQQVDGSPGSIGLTFKYRTRTEFGDFVDQIRAEIDAKAATEMDQLKDLAAKKQPILELSQKEILRRETETNVGYIMGFVEGWDLDVAFDRAAVLQLGDEVPAAIPAIIDSYRDAIVDGRLGN